MAAGNPILEQLVAVLREDTAVDVTLTGEGGGYFVQVIPDGAVIGPMDHAQAWYCLLGLWTGRNARQTLDTEKMRRERETHERMNRIILDRDRIKGEADSDPPTDTA